MGYNPEFIGGYDIPLPTPGNHVVEALHTDENFIHHLRYSLLFHKVRGFAICTAHNIDGAALPDAQYTGRSFRFDPAIDPTSLQVDRNRGYSGDDNQWDQGHLTRRKSMSWGDEADARIAERESDFWSNIAPQHETLHDDAWGSIEDWVLVRVVDGQARACVFQGPVLTEEDPIHQNGPNEDPIRIPAGFWKVIAVEHESRMRAATFLLWQRDYDSDVPLPFAPILEQVRLTTIEMLTGLGFPALRLFDPMLFDRNQNLRPEITRDRIANAGRDFLAAQRFHLDQIQERPEMSITPMIMGMEDILL